MNPDWRNRYEVAVSAAKEAGKHALGYFDSDVDVEWKMDRSPVTKADKESEDLLRKRIQENFPQDGILGEEYGDMPGTSGFRWILDPIDGTRSYVRGIPLWATLVGLEYQKEPIAGVVEIPAMGQTYRALRGEGAFRDDRPIQVSGIDSMEKSHLYYSSLNWFIGVGKHEIFMNLVRRTERQRGYGDFYGFVLVAEGCGELMVEYGCSPWDLCALSAILKEAGGILTNWQGEETIYSRDNIASNQKVHQEALEILQGKN